MAGNKEKVFTDFAQTRLAAAITAVAATCTIIDEPTQLFTALTNVFKILDDCGDTSDIDDWEEIVIYDGLNPVDNQVYVKEGSHSMELGVDADLNLSDFAAWINSQAQGDLSAYQHDWIYIWVYLPTLDYFDLIPALQFKIGSDSANRLTFNWNKAVLSVGWNLLKCDLDNPDVIDGTVNWAAIDYQAIVVMEETENTNDFTVYVDSITLATHGVFYMTLVDASANREIVNVLGISSKQLWIERGQGGSTVRAWPIGTLIEQRPTAADMAAFLQPQAFRTVAYNPNGVLTAAYPGEKVYQTDAGACKKRWWKNVTGTSWQCIAGTICAGEVWEGGYIVAGWELVAEKYDMASTIYDLVIFNDELYGGTGVEAELLKWNGVDAWELELARVGTQTSLESLCVFNDKLYGTFYNSGKLYEWTGVGGWVQVAAQYVDGLPQRHIRSLIVFNDKLYGSTEGKGILLEWNGVDAWVKKASQVGGESIVFSLTVFNDKLYGGTGTSKGCLYEWNGVDAWVEKAPQFGSETHIYGLAVFNDKLYGGTRPNANLLEWNGVDEWVQKAPQYEAEYYIYSLAVFNDKLYGGSYDHAYLLEWNGVDDWIEAGVAGDETYIISLCVFNNRLYAGTIPRGNLYRL